MIIVISIIPKKGPRSKEGLERNYTHWYLVCVDNDDLPHGTIAAINKNLNFP
jgi:hypothetical protein